eukprot:5976472-Prymnesium_polylepis.1
MGRPLVDKGRASAPRERLHKRGIVLVQHENDHSTLPGRPLSRGTAAAEESSRPANATGTDTDASTVRCLASHAAFTCNPAVEQSFARAALAVDD